MDGHAVLAHRFPVPARPIRSGRTLASLSTKPRRLLFGVRRDVRARHRANRNPRGFVSSDLVPPPTFWGCASKFCNGGFGYVGLWATEVLISGSTLLTGRDRRSNRDSIALSTRKLKIITAKKPNTIRQTQSSAGLKSLDIPPPPKS